jgi:hypothetical protein
LNTGVQLIHVDRSDGNKLTKIEQFLKPTCEEALKYFDRCNRMEFDIDQKASWEELDLADPSNWHHVNYKTR